MIMENNRNYSLSQDNKMRNWNAHYNYSPHAYNAIYSVEKITPRMMVMNFHLNPHTTVISCYILKNVSDEQYTDIF